MEFSVIGGGTYMRADILSPDHPSGTSPQDKGTPIWADLGSLRKGQAPIATPPGVTNLPYIQGHLLNQQLGGPGRMYNLTPITENSNVHDHEKNVEKHVKSWVNDKKKVAYYEVTADYPSPTTPASLTTQKQKEAFATKKLVRELTCTAYKKEFDGTSWKKAKTDSVIPGMLKEKVTVKND